MPSYRTSLIASVLSPLISVLAAANSTLIFAVPSFGQDATHPLGQTPGGDNTGLTVKFSDVNGTPITKLRLCAGGIDVFNGVDDTVHAATITITLMHGDKVADPGEGIGLMCYFDGFEGGSSTKVLPPLLRAPSANGLTSQVPLAVGADGTASLRVVSSNLITTANLEVKADSDGGGILGTLPCTFGQSYGFRYKGLIGTNPQGFDLVPLPESPITLPPWSVGIPALPVWQPGDDVVVYNSGYDTDLGWEYSPLVLSATGQVMTATLHLTFQRDDTLAPSPNYFLHNHVPVPKIISNDDTVNLLLPNASNFAPVQGHKLRVTFTPYREWLVQSVEIQLVPSDEAQYYVYVSPKAVSMGPKVRLGTAEVTTDAQGLAVVSLTAGERINTCRYFELQVTDLTQLEQ